MILINNDNLIFPMLDHNIDEKKIKTKNNFTIVYHYINILYSN